METNLINFKSNSNQDLDKSVISLCSFSEIFVYALYTIYIPLVYILHRLYHLCIVMIPNYNIRDTNGLF